MTKEKRQAMDKEMIVTALRCRKNREDSNHLCAQCRYSYAIYCDIYELFGDAADLIEEQAVEIERLTAESRLTPKMVTCPKGWQGIRDTRFYCPGCKKAARKGEAYCHKCGQALMFPVERYDKENNRILLDFSDRGPQGTGEGV